MGHYKSEDCAGTRERVSERLEAQASPPPAGLFPCSSLWHGPVSPALSAAEAHLPPLAALLSRLGSVCSLPCSTFPPQQPMQGPSDSSMSNSHGTRGHIASQLEVTFQGMCPGASEQITLLIIATSRKKSLSGLIFTLSPSSPAEVRFQTLHASSTTSFLPSASGLPNPTGQSSCPQHWLLRSPSASQHRKLLLAHVQLGPAKHPPPCHTWQSSGPWSSPTQNLLPFALLSSSSYSRPLLLPPWSKVKTMPAASPPLLTYRGPQSCPLPAPPLFKVLRDPPPTGSFSCLPSLSSPLHWTQDRPRSPQPGLPTPAPVAWTRPPHLRP